METVILCPYELDADGVVHYYFSEDYFEIRYSLNFNEKSRVATLWGLSSKKPFNYPCKIDIPLVKNGRAEGVRQLSCKDLGINGYSLTDIDTFALICKSPIGLCVAALGYGGLTWNISYSIGRILKDEDDSVLYDCRKKLEKLKKPSVKESDYKWVLDGLKTAAFRLEKIHDEPLEGYRWYKYTKDLFPFGISIYAHLTDTEEFAKAYQNGRECLLGLRDMCHTALAMKCNHNPFVNAQDVAVFVNGYWIAGVGLFPEGQFFEIPCT